MTSEKEVQDDVGLIVGPIFGTYRYTHTVEHAGVMA